jgi:methionyl-tRNA formyltransferase
MRVAFLGNAPWSVPSVKAVATSRHQLVIVATRSPRPGRRGTGSASTPVAEAARELEARLVETDTVKSDAGFDALGSARPDVLAVVAYGEILPQAVLDLPAVAPVNVHFSLLPKLRGAAPVQRAIMAGLPVTGVTTIRMDAGMDTGPILLQREEPIRDGDDAGTLGERLSRKGARLLVETLDALEVGDLKERQQDEGEATYAPKLGPEDRVLDWGGQADEVVRRVRALSPEPGAETYFRGRLLKVFGASIDASSGPPPSHPVPGSLMPTRGQAPLVWCADGAAVRLDQVAPEGRRRMIGQDFTRGYRPKQGEILG